MTHFHYSQFKRNLRKYFFALGKSFVIVFVLIHFSTHYVTAQNKSIDSTLKAINELKLGKHRGQKVYFGRKTTLCILDGKVVEMEEIYNLLNNSEKKFSITVFSPSDLKMGIVDKDIETEIKWVIVASTKPK